MKPGNSKSDRNLRYIHGPELRREIETVVKSHEGNEDGFAPALQEIEAGYGKRSIRMKKINSTTRVTVRHGRGKRFHKTYASAVNSYVDIFEAGGKWSGETFSLVGAGGGAGTGRGSMRDPDARLIMRVHKNDMVILEDKDGIEKTCRVTKLEQDRLVSAEQFNAGDLKRRGKDKEDSFHPIRRSFSVLRKLKCRRKLVDVMGRVVDPGPRRDVKHNPPHRRKRKSRRTGEFSYRE